MLRPASLTLPRGTAATRCAAAARPRAPRRAGAPRVLAFRQPTADAAAAAQQRGAASAASAKGARRDFLEARQLSLYELFDGSNFVLDVPEYQRPYAWRAKQVHELLSDLHAAYVSGQEHFLGAVVTTRQGDAPGEPYWVIDGQQRLTTLVMLLGYLRAWASSTPGMGKLAERVGEMLHIPADPLNAASTPRYRLLLRSSEQEFFTANFIEAFLPTRFHLSTQLDGPANAGGDYHDALSALGGGAGGAGAAGPGVERGAERGSSPLANEAWWRLYCAGDVLACYLASAMADGLNLQDFMHHVLKSCMLVLMTARDEGTSFKIFSTLNGRGVDLAVVDKLKPELLQALPPARRQSYADRWRVLESSLGRPTFHGLFAHYVAIEAARRAENGGGGGAAASWAHTPDAPAGAPPRVAPAAGGGGGAAPYVPPGSTLIGHLPSGGPAYHQLSAAAGGGGPGGARPDVLSALSGHPDVGGVLDQVLEYGQRLLQIRANDWSALEAEGGTAPGIAAELSEACFFANLLSDDAWQPWALEFFYQSADDAKRAAFLRGAEVLTLFCELKQDEAFKRERWLAVGSQLLQRPFYSDQVLAALALSPDETDEFVKLLDSRELAASTDDAVLVHLLLRADSINRRTLDWRRLKVERIMPTHPPEGSTWRKQKLLLPALSEEQLAAGGGPGASGGGYATFAAGRTRGSSGGASRGSRSSRGRTTTSSSGAGGAPPAAGADESAGGDAAAAGAGGGAGVPPGMREVRFWHEITRSHWHARLGNLILLQPSGQESAATGHLTADLPAKLAHYAACAADEHFPDFSGGLLSGRYARDGFSPEECRQRHADIIARLVRVFGLEPSV
ncbi:hypothetical protein HT031_001955 [Scenedesmus sp. PABB004]|nr:hypothetical protein HT031_001955 [Scenedesmus sp. PABB004]